MFLNVFKTLTNLVPFSSVASAQLFWLGFFYSSLSVTLITERV